MSYLLGGLCAAQIILLLVVVRAFLADISEREDAMSLERISWGEERRELLNRVQRPDILPSLHEAPYPDPEPSTDDVELVGTIVYREEGPA